MSQKGDLCAQPAPSAPFPSVVGAMLHVRLSDPTQLPRNVVFFIVVALLVACATCLRMNPVSSTYDIQSTKFLGKTFEHAVFETKFDDELYVMRQWACSCHGGGGDPPCPLALASPASPPADESGFNFTVLQEGQWHSDVIETEYGQAHYKFELVSDPTMPCPMIHIDKEVETGSLSAFISVGLIPSAADRMWYSPYFGYSTITICPMHPNFTYGTYYLTLVNQRSSSMNSYRVRFRLQNSPSCLSSIPDPSPLPASHNAWLQDGMAYTSALDYPNLDFYSFSSRSRCTNLSISVNKHNTGDLDMYVSTKNPYPQFGDSASHEWHSTVDGDDRVNIAFCDPNPAALYSVFYIGVRAAAVGFATYDIVATVQQWTEAHPIAALSYGQSMYELSYGAFPLLNCSLGQVFTCGFPTYSQCFNDGFDCCYRFGPIAPTPVSQALWPWSEADTSIGDAQWTIPWADVHASEPGKLAWSLQLSTSTPDSLEQYTYGDIGECVLTVSNAIVTRAGLPLVPTGSRASIEFTKKSFSCDNGAFEAAKASVEALSEGHLAEGVSDTFSRLGLQQLRLAIAAIAPAIRGCEAFVDALVEHVTRQDQYGSSTNCYELEGSAAWLADACCNLARKECCNPRPFLLARSVPSEVRAANIEAACQTPDCSKATVKSWIDSVNRASTVGGPGCDRIVNQVASLDALSSISAFISECRQSIAGEDLLGAKCTSNSDCLSGSTCNPLSLRCNHDDNQVVDCLVANMPRSVSRILYDTWGLTEAVTAPVLKSELISRVFFNQCIGPTARRYLPGYHWQPQVAGCTDQCSADGADPYCFDRSCPVPKYCDGASGTGACYRFYGPTVNDTDGCLADESCNWKRCIVGEPNYDSCMTSCTTGSVDVCVDCSGDWCEEVASITTSTRCGQGLCSVDEAETSSSACANKGICSSTCATCDTEIGCLAQGACNDRVLVPQGGVQSGFCSQPPVFVVTSSSWDCSNDDTTMTVVGCVFENLTEVECGSVGGGAVWTSYASDEAECISLSGCYDASNEMIFLNQTECGKCGGYTWRANYNWTSSSVWTSGRMHALSWRPRAVVASNSVGLALSYTTLMEIVNEAITSQYAFAYRTHALCHYDSPLRLIHSASCDCNSGSSANEDDASTCFSSISNSQVGSGLGCAFLSSEIKTPVGSLSIQETSYPPGRCSQVGLYFTPSSQYQLSSSFNLAVFRSSAVNSFWIVKNANDATVGQIVSGAIRVEMDSTLVDPAILCLDIDTSLGVDETAINYVLAELDEDEVIRAFSGDNQAFLDTSGRVCGYITKTGTYFASKLIKDYDSAKLRTTSETAQYRSAAVLFALTAVFGVVQGTLLLLNAAQEKILLQKMVFIGIIVLDCIIRAVFVSLPPNAFKPSAAAGQFTIFELPSFLFFTVFTAIVYLWIMVIAKTGVLGNRRALKHRKRTIFRTYVGGNLVMYLIFIVFIILIAILPSLQKKSPCFLGTASSDAAGSDVSYTIKLAYWIFVFIVSVVVALAFLIAASLLLRLMSKSVGMRKKKSSNNNTSIAIITSVAVVCSIVILIRSSVFLWSAKTGNPVNVLVFAFLEIIPQAFLLFYLHPFRVFRDHSTTSATDSKGSAEFTTETPRSRTANSRNSNNDTTKGHSIKSLSGGDSSIELDGIPYRNGGSSEAIIAPPETEPRKARPKKIRTKATGSEGQQPKRKRASKASVSGGNEV